MMLLMKGWGINAKSEDIFGSLLTQITLPTAPSDHTVQLKGIWVVKELNKTKEVQALGSVKHLEIV